MRKTFFLFLLLLLSFSWTNMEAQNIYASELSASAVNATDGSVTFTYTLNAAATEVVITVGSNVFTINGTVPAGQGLSKGVNNVTRQLAMSTPQGNYPWTVKATRAATTSITQFSDDTSPQTQFFAAVGGLAIDNNTESPHFGRVYVSCTVGGAITANPSPVGTRSWGIYILNSALQDVTGQGNNGYQGGMTQSSTGSVPPQSPYRISVMPDGKLLVTDATPGNSDIFIMNPATKTTASANFPSIFAGGGTRNTTSGAYTVGGVELHRGTLAAHVIGNDLYFLDWGFVAGNVSYTTVIKKYAGWNTSRPAISTKGADWCAAGGNTGLGLIYYQTSGTDLVPDGQGGFWLWQYRGTEDVTNNDFWHMNSSGVRDFNSFNWAATGGGTRIGSGGFNGGTGNIAFNTRTKQLAIHMYNATTTTIRFYNNAMTGSNVTMPGPASSTFSAPGGTTNGMAYDYANNLYLVNRSNERLKAYALPKNPNTETTPAPSSQKVSVPVLVSPNKQFIVTVPNGTERVYAVGDFNGWDENNPVELTKIDVNKFEAYINCNVGDGYKYLCESGSWDYVEGVAGASGQPAIQRPTNRSVSGSVMNDTGANGVPFWYNVKKVTFEVTFNAGVTVPDNLSVHFGPNNWSSTANVSLTKSGNTFTGSYGGNAGDKFRTNSKYIYFTDLAGEEIYENRNYGDDRWTIAPKMGDVVLGFQSPLSLTGDYYIPKSTGLRGWSDLSAAFASINALGIDNDVNLLITDDIEQSASVGIVNNTNYFITIKPNDATSQSSIGLKKSSGNVKRSITFTQTSANAGGIAGAFIIGCKTGLSFTDVAPANNIILENLTLTTASSAFASNVPIVILDASQDISIKNCKIEHKPTGGGSYAIWLRGLVSATTYPPATYPNIQRIMPKDVTIEGNEIINIGYGSGQAIGVDADTPPVLANRTQGLVVKNNILKGRSRGIFLTETEGISCTGNEIRITQTSSGFNSQGIYGYTNTSGIMNISGNKFIELSSANDYAGNYGIRAIYVSTGTATWNIENNYFTGFDKTIDATSASTVNNSSLQAICTNVAGVTLNIRHNTFYLNKLTNLPVDNISNPSAGVGASGGSAPNTFNSYSAINISAASSTIQNNLFVSDENAGYNFFFTGNAPADINNNVYCLAGGMYSNYTPSGSTPPSIPRTIGRSAFSFKSATDLGIVSTKDPILSLEVPLSSTSNDITGAVRGSTGTTGMTYAGAFEFFPNGGLTGIEENSIVNGVRIVCTGNQITIISDDVIQSVRLYDLQGRMLDSKQNVQNKVYPLTAPGKGIYTLETITASGRNVQKIAIR